MSLFLMLALFAGLQEPRELGSASVGMPVSVRELLLPGSELEVVPSTDATPVIVRIDAVRPHGAHQRYDLEWYGLEPGAYDLGSFLRRKDGTELELPPLPLVVSSLLAPGQVEPHRPSEGALPSLGGYRWTLAVAGALWLLGVLAFLRAGRRKRVHAFLAAPRAPSSTARLRTLVTSAQAGVLAPAERAELELALIALWKRRLGLFELEATAALTQLHAHPEAGPLLAALEGWLHRPEHPSIDLEALLAPYARLEDEQPSAAAPAQAAPATAAELA